MSISHQKAWYQKNAPNDMPAHLTTSVAKSKSAQTAQARVKAAAREKMSLKAYGATTGTKVGEIGGEKAAGPRDTIVPLSPEQHSKVQAAKKASTSVAAKDTSKPVVKREPAAPKPKRTGPLTTSQRLAAISRAARKAKEKHDVPTADPEDSDHDDLLDVHHSLHIGGGRNQYSEERSPRSEYSANLSLAADKGRHQTPVSKGRDYFEYMAHKEGKKKPQMGVKLRGEEAGWMLKADAKLRQKVKDKVDKQKQMNSSMKKYGGKTGEEIRAMRKEEVENIEERLSKYDTPSKWIQDFVRSDDPRFSGKSKKERIDMALGAYYSKKRKQ
jgi:hypothetical protein